MPVALAFAVLDLGDATDLGVVLGCQWAARVAFLLAGGVWGDRLPRQVVMMAADVLRAGVQALVALAFFTDVVRVWHLAVASALFGLASAFFNPASTGLVPKLVSKDRLQEANALLGLSRSSVEVIGPAASGIVVTTLGFGLVFAVDAVTFVASFSCLAAMRIPRSLEALERRSMIADALGGLRIVREQRWILAGLVGDIAFNLALAAYFVLGPVVIEKHFGGARDWGIMMTAAYIGGILGGFAALRFKPERPLLVAYVFSFVTPLQLLALAPPLPLAILIVGASLVVIAMVLVNTFWATMEQQHVPAEYLARVDSLVWMISLIALPAGMVLVGPLSSAIGTETTLVAAAALASVGLLGALSVGEFRNLRRREFAAD